MKMSRSVYHYHSVAADQTPLRQRIREIAATRVRYGYKRIYVVLRREGWRINLERVDRLYKQDDLSLFERRPRRDHSGAHRPPPRATVTANEWWSMDFSMVRPQTQALPCPDDEERLACLSIQPVAGRVFPSPACMAKPHVPAPIGLKASVTSEV